MKKYICLLISAALLSASMPMAFAEDTVSEVPAAEMTALTEDDIEVMAAQDGFSFEYLASGQKEKERYFYVKYNSARFTTGISSFRLELKADSSNIVGMECESTDSRINITSQSYDADEKVFTCEGGSAALVVAPDARILKIKVTLDKPMAIGATHTIRLYGNSKLSNGTIEDSYAAGGMNAAEIVLEPMSGIDEQLPGANEGVSGSINWRFEGDTKTLVLSGHGNMADYTETNHAPWVQEGAEDKIKHIKLEEGSSITSGGAYAFCGLSAVSDVDLSAGNIAAIGNHAFDGCASLSSIDLGTVGGIGIEAFKGCTSLKSVVVPNSTTSIGKGAFAGCTSIEDITIPFIGGQKTSYDKTFGYIFNDSVPSSIKTVRVKNADRIPNNAFKDCTSIEKIYINDVNEIGISAFENCSSLVKFEIPTTVQKVPERCFFGCSSLSELYLYDSMSDIGVSAMEGCSSLTKINETNTIPASMTTLRDYIFKGCSSLDNIIIPSTITTINTGVLEGCTSMHVVTIPFVGMVDGVADALNAVANQQFGWLFNCANNKVPASVTKVTVLNADRNSEIPPYAFAGCSYIEDINVKGGKAVNKCAFENCAALKYLSLPRTVTTIEETILAGVTNLETLIVPFIGKTANSTEVPESVIGAFFGHSASKFNNSDYMKYNETEGMYYYVPKTLKNVAVLSQVNIPYGAFNSLQNLEKVSFISGAKLGAHAFEQCQYLEAVKLPENMKTIGAQAFANCFGLKRINIPSLVQTIGESAFYNCESLTDITIPASVTGLDMGVFEGCGVKKPVDDSEDIFDFAANYMVFKGVKGSDAEKLANANGIQFIEVSADQMATKSTLTIASVQSDDSLQLDVTADEDVTGTVYAALYNAKGQVIAVKTAPKLEKEVNTQLNFTEEEKAGAVASKTFIWNGMKPITNAEVTKL